MVRYPVDPRRISTHSNIYDYEILETFFRNHDIVPVWLNSHYSWGWYDEEAGRWTGAVGMVRDSRQGECVRTRAANDPRPSRGLLRDWENRWIVYSSGADWGLLNVSTD